MLNQTPSTPPSVFPTRPSQSSLRPPELPNRPPRHHRLRWTVLSIAAIAIVVLVTGGWLAYRAISVINTKKLDGSRLSFFQQLTHIVTASTQQLQGEADDRINILLLGYGGPGHDGPYLTDTMMVASFQPSTKKLALLSIPRDLVVDVPGYDYRKINSVLSFGRDQKYPGGGEALTVKVVSDLLDLPIQYYARVDFDGFKDIIDRLNGLTVTVDRTFSDSQYPDNNYGYAPIKFVAGQQTMNGDLALKFTRSRHGNNGEGSDFARAARQQKIIVALKDKLLSFGTLANPKKVSDILGSLGSHSQTNMEVWEMLRLAKIAGNLPADRIVNKVLDDSANGFLRAATGLGGAFILVPRDNSYSDIRFLARYIFLDGTAESELAKILVVNATNFPNLGTNTAHELAALGFVVVKTMSLPQTSAAQTVLVSATPGQHPLTEQLLNLYKHPAGTLSLSDWQRRSGDTVLAATLATPITTYNNANLATTVTPDLVLVLGQDQPPLSTSTSPAVVTTNTNTSSTTNTNTKSTNSNSSTSNTNAKSTNANISTNKNTNSVISP